MALISTRTHAAGDYAGGALMLAAAQIPLVRDRRAATLLRAAGAATLATAALTDYELGIWRKLPVPVHLALDAASGALMAGSAMLLRRSGAGVGSWLPHALIGVGELAGAVVTERAPSAGASGTPAEDMPAATPGVTGEGMAARESGLGVPVAPAPVEAPGPSVTPPAQPESDIERAERIDAGLPDSGAAAAGDDLVAQQEAAAAAEAAAIGGPPVHGAEDPAMDPVYQAGGGEQEGFEMAEAELIENATHGDGHGQPERDRLTPELESDRATAVYGEADHEISSELMDEQEAGGGRAGEARDPRGPREGNA